MRWASKIKVITGYKGTADTHLAMARGEVDALTIRRKRQGAISDLFQNTVQPFQYGLTRSGIPDVPLLHELVSGPDQAKLIPLPCQ